MKDRRPRKLKKVLKKRFQSAVALKTLKCALITAGSAFQMVAIQSRPIPKFEEGSQLAIETAQSISNIMNSGPKNWREA